MCKCLATAARLAAPSGELKHIQQQYRLRVIYITAPVYLHNRCTSKHQITIEEEYLQLLNLMKTRF
jgi:hypothetical protein